VRGTVAITRLPTSTRSRGCSAPSTAASIGSSDWRSAASAGRPKPKTGVPAAPTTVRPVGFSTRTTSATSHPPRIPGTRITSRRAMRSASTAAGAEVVSKAVTR
jgi:hypothetical protein